MSRRALMNAGDFQGRENSRDCDHLSPEQCHDHSRGRWKMVHPAFHFGQSNFDLRNQRSRLFVRTSIRTSVSSSRCIPISTPGSWRPTPAPAREVARLPGAIAFCGRKHHQRPIKPRRKLFRTTDAHGCTRIRQKSLIICVHLWFDSSALFRLLPGPGCPVLLQNAKCNHPASLPWSARLCLPAGAFSGDDAVQPALMIIAIPTGAVVIAVISSGTSGSRSASRLVRACITMTAMGCERRFC